MKTSLLVALHVLLVPSPSPSLNLSPSLNRHHSPNPPLSPPILQHMSNRRILILLRILLHGTTRVAFRHRPHISNTSCPRRHVIPILCGSLRPPNIRLSMLRGQVPQTTLITHGTDLTKIGGQASTIRSRCVFSPVSCWCRQYLKS